MAQTTLGDGLIIGAGDHITFGDSTVLASSPTGGFKNKIINGAFDVWQRGTSFSASGYSADRWLAYFSGGTTTFGFSADSPSGILSSIYIASTASNVPQIYQRIESFNAAPLEGQKATLSFYAKQTAGSSQLTASLQYANSADNFGATTSIETFTATSLTSGWVRYSFTTSNVMPAGSANGVQVILAKGNSDTSTWLITGVQLESGSVATPFETRSIGQELALCQRYYYRIFPNVSNMTVTQAGYAANGTTGYGINKFPVTMRAAPSALDQTGVAGNYRYVQGSGVSIVCSSVPTFVQATQEDAWTQFSVVSGLTISAAGVAANASGGSSAYLGWSAEL